MFHLIKSLAKFITALFVMSILCTVVWQFVGSKLYDCTDDGFLGFTRPGDWVHPFGGHPVSVVYQIVHGRSMSEPDTIKEGWSVAGLWRLWYDFVLLSLGISMLLAWIPWTPRRSTALNYEHPHTA
jgi:hypothetical protein